MKFLEFLDQLEHCEAVLRDRMKTPHGDWIVVIEDSSGKQFDFDVCVSVGMHVYIVFSVKNEHEND